MCLAVPGKVVAKEGKAYVVSYGSSQRKVPALVQCAVGEYVLVQFGTIVEVIPERDALEAIKAFNRLSR